MGEGTYRKKPSVRTERSCSTNQYAFSPSTSASSEALTERLPMRLRVYMLLPFALLLGGYCEGPPYCWG